MVARRQLRRSGLHSEEYALQKDEEKNRLARLAN